MSLNKPFQEKNHLQDSLWLLMDSIRNLGLTYDEILACLISLSVIAKESPDCFHILANVEPQSQKEFLFEIIKKNVNLIKDDEFHIAANEYIPSTAFVQLITYIAKIKDFNIFADLLIYAFQKASSNGFGNFITEQVIIDIIKNIVGDASQLTVYDGAAGICALTSQLDANKLVLEDINVRARAIGKGIFLLKNLEVDYAVTNSLITGKKSVNADLVVTQAPWGVRFSLKDIENIKDSKYILLKEKTTIPTSANDSIWIQHSIYHLNDNGRAILLMPQGWLFRGGYDAELRSHLLESDLIEAVMFLPSGMLRHTSIPTVILILKRNKTNKNVVHFVDVNQLASMKKRRGELDQDEIKLIASALSGGSSDNTCHRVVTLEEIKENNNDLSIRHYFKNEDNLKISDLGLERKLLEVAQHNFISANKKLMELLAE